MTADKSRHPDPDEPVLEVAQLLVRSLLVQGVTAAAGRDAAAQLDRVIALQPQSVVHDGPLRRVRIDVRRKLATARTTHQVRDESRLSWSIDALARGSDASVSAEQCMAAATRAADPPADAELIEHGWDRSSGSTEYRAVWSHRVDGVQVERDRIEVWVNGRTGRVCAVVRRWHAIDRTPKPA